MSFQELELRLQRIKNKKRAGEVRRFVMNLYVLFDGHLPVHIERSIDDIFVLLD